MKTSWLALPASMVASALLTLGLTPVGEGNAHAAPITTTGKLQIEIELTASKALRDGSRVSVVLDVYASDATYYNDRETTTRGALYVSGGVAKATINVPYEMTLSDRSARIYVRTYFNAPSYPPTNYSDYLQSIDLPADGAITTVHVVGAL